MQFGGVFVKIFVPLCVAFSRGLRVTFNSFCVYCVTVDTLVVVWLNFGVCMYVY